MPSVLCSVPAKLTVPLVPPVLVKVMVLKTVWPMFVLPGVVNVAEISGGCGGNGGIGGVMKIGLNRTTSVAVWPEKTVSDVLLVS